MLRNIDYSDHYWLADDGRLYKSRTAEVVTVEDGDYQAFVLEGGVASWWPRAADGTQTMAALQAVLRYYGIDLLSYAEARRYAVETGGVATPFGRAATDDRSKTMILGALLAAMGDASWSTTWQFADGASATLDRAGIATISSAVQAHVNGVFQAFAGVKAGLAASPPTITTRAQIDAAFAALAA